jgi:hypothetical protein
MVIKESQVKAIIQEEIQKMLEEGEIDEAIFSGLAGKAKEMVGKAARLGGLTSADLAAQEKAAAEKESAQKVKTAAAEKEKASEKRKKEINQLYSDITAKIGGVEQSLLKMEDYLTPGYSKIVQDAAKSFSSVLERAVANSLGHKGQFKGTMAEKKD